MELIPQDLTLHFLQQTQPSGWGQPFPPVTIEWTPACPNQRALLQAYQSTTAQTMLKGLRDIPTISIAMDRADFSGGSGIYTNSTNGSLEYECSAEYIPATIDSRDDWQVNCGIKVQGGASRNPGSSPKHSMNFRFRTQYVSDVFAKTFS